MRRRRELFFLDISLVFRNWFRMEANLLAPLFVAYQSGGLKFHAGSGFWTYLLSDD